MCGAMSTNKRILISAGKGPARRNLFGPVDHEQLKVEYQAALRQDQEEASARWGFDFMSDKPVESSRFQWEGIPVAKVPLLYRSCTLGVGQPEGQRAAAVKPKGRRGLGSKDKESIRSSPEKRKALHPGNLGNLEKTATRRESTGLKMKQTNITDFYQIKRRAVWTPHKSDE